MTLLPTGTVTFLFTDIEGSTKLWELHPDAMKSALARHDALLRRAIESNHGYVFKTVGDAFCAAFPTAPEGLQAALAAQRALRDENWGETPIKVRMALHTGNTEERDGDYFGPPLNRVARLMCGHGGQVLLSQVTFDLVRDQLPAHLTLRDLSEHRLKDLVRPEHIFQVVAPDLPAEFPPLKTLDALPNNLPIQLTSFIGREQELAEVKRLLSNTRLMTLTGAGGTGKTRLALQVGAEQLDTFADGVWFVELAAVSKPELVPHAAATVFSIREDAGRPLMITLQDSLRVKNLVLILDNCEHLIEACAQLADTLLRGCPGLKIIATSREALGIAGESTFRVPSLSLPDPHRLPTIASLTQFDAVRLFIDRAVSAKSDFQITNANAPAVAQVCHRLDGIPLAIELAAARVKGLSVEQLAARLDDRFRLLTGGSRTALPRQQTLRTSIDWSYDLLSEAERGVLRRLSVFVGDWSLEAAESVVGQDAILAYNVLDLLLRLVDKSLVAEEEQGGEAHYRLLETIRQYAHDKLIESGEAERVRARHLDFFLRFAEQAEPELRSAEQLIWLDRKQSEYENLRVALDWARESNSTESGLRLASAMEQLADVQTLLGVGTQAIPLYQSALELWQSVVGADKMIGLRLHGKIVQTVTLLSKRIDFDRFVAVAHIAAVSRANLERELELIEGQSQDPELVRVLTTLSRDAWIIRRPLDLEKAEQYARAAVDMAEKLDGPVELSAALSALSEVYFGRGLWREHMQVSMRRQALSRDPRFSDMQERVSALIDTGYALLNVGEYGQVIPYLTEAEGLASQIQAINLEQWALEARTYCLFRLDRWDEILNIDEKLRDIQRRYPRERIGAACFVIALIASVHALRGEFELAAVQRAEANAIMTAVAGSPEQWERPQHY